MGLRGDPDAQAVAAKPEELSPIASNLDEDPSASLARPNSGSIYE